MKKKKNFKKEIENMSVLELKNRLKKLYYQLFNLKIHNKISSLKNPIEIKSLRRNIARLKTLINNISIKK
ncbi:MAG: 50S ribosomal protein L29 [Endomicrobium sp.]|jgi:large subunit ribosomal protein L29|nr:50S ribosomal protein L29 [Endomicrobium sp.]